MRPYAQWSLVNLLTFDLLRYLVTRGQPSEEVLSPAVFASVPCIILMCYSHGSFIVISRYAM